METVIDYLQDPMKAGVYTSNIIVEVDSFIQYFEELLTGEKQNPETETEKDAANPAETHSVKRIKKMSHYLQKLKEEKLERNVFWGALDDALRTFARTDDFPRVLSDFYYLTQTEKLSSGQIIERKRPISRLESYPFDSFILGGICDVNKVENENRGLGKMEFNVTSLTENGITSFQEKLFCIPSVKEKAFQGKTHREFSSRYVFRPYPLVVELWLQKNMSRIPDQLGSLMSSSARHIDYWACTEEGGRAESIVLSSAVIEIALADLYEKRFEESARNVTRKLLLDRLKQETDFPPHIVQAIEISNNARKSAIHGSASAARRSGFEVSRREALSALYGAMNLLLWYSQN